MSIPDFILLTLAIIGGFIGLAGYMSGREKHISDDAEWKGIVNTKLDAIHSDISGVSKDITEIKAAQADTNKKVENHETRITVLENKVDRREKAV